MKVFTTQTDTNFGGIVMNEMIYSGPPHTTGFYGVCNGAPCSGPSQEYWFVWDTFFDSTFNSFSCSGAIPEVAGSYAHFFTPGDWLGLAQRLREVLSGTAPASRDAAERYSTAAAAARLAAAYEEMLSGTGTRPREEASSRS